MWQGPLELRRRNAKPYSLRMCLFVRHGVRVMAVGECKRVALGESVSSCCPPYTPVLYAPYPAMRNGFPTINFSAGSFSILQCLAKCGEGWAGESKFTCHRDRTWHGEAPQCRYLNPLYNKPDPDQPRDEA